MSLPQLPAQHLAPLRRSLLTWFAEAARQLPWRTAPRDPYLVWVSEIMLQQTRVSTVVPYFLRFIDHFPDVAALADAHVDEVLTLWSGLGYYRRARTMHQAAQVIVHEHGGTFPEDLLALPGVGPYTSAAVGSLAFGRPVAVMDGNVHRVLSRLTGCELPVGTSQATSWAREQAQYVLDKEQPGMFNEAMMELGALVCTPTTPACSDCPALPWCEAARTGRASELPVMAKKKTPTNMQFTALVVRWGNRLVLAQRKMDGLYGGMWEPMLLEGTTEQVRELVAPSKRRCVVRGHVRHLLTHRRLSVQVCELRVRPTTSWPEAWVPASYSQVRWFTDGQLAEVALSTLAKKILTKSG